jgi:hypothetical protein
MLNCRFNFLVGMLGSSHVSSRVVYWRLHMLSSDNNHSLPCNYVVGATRPARASSASRRGFTGFMSNRKGHPKVPCDPTWIGIKRDLLDDALVPLNADLDQNSDPEVAQRGRNLDAWQAA